MYLIEYFFVIDISYIVQKPYKLYKLSSLLAFQLVISYQLLVIITIRTIKITSIHLKEYFFVINIGYVVQKPSKLYKLYSSISKQWVGLSIKGDIFQNKVLLKNLCSLPRGTQEVTVLDHFFCVFQKIFPPKP